MKVFIVNVEGHVRFGGDTAIDPDQYEAGAYSAGEGKLDFEPRPGRTISRRLGERSVATLTNTNPTSHGYGGIGQLCVHCCCGLRWL